MNTYYLYIKSHGEYPDFEEEVEAKNKKEAIEKFLDMLGSCMDIKDKVIKLKGGE